MGSGNRGKLVGQLTKAHPVSGLDVAVAAVAEQLAQPEVGQLDVAGSGNGKNRFLGVKFIGLIIGRQLFNTSTTLKNGLILILGIFQSALP